ncbi:hypothetical protein Noc_0708 [Nitrosococcus oceani ATCC 19707]|uniref:Wadjet protein JetD C-terminal domain-containing protein n=3 Tax=Nitrosococcus oceani TaxID=1229 RepID=Q3JD74_NITOC|nr:hypothetical protein Noc_0708 [Nitrosococcus oceani ATCC 19707]EDZ66225.1 hypothetical protein NOC27_2905 [Nitrosococcus oceani AFC27]KFI20356.1 hypothetical protein IB75_03560 [Nitrosococcus oceani C-27]
MSPMPLRDRITNYLRKRARMNASLRGNGLVERLVRDLQCDRTEVLREFRELRAEGILVCDDWLREEPLSKVTVNLPEESNPTVKLWHAVLEQAAKIQGEFAALEPLGEIMEGLHASEMTGLLNGLVSLKQDQERLHNTPRFEVSARYLLGSSKLLDALPTASLRQFGIDVNRFPAFPGYVMVAGPPDPCVVVLVENPHAFECALDARGTDRAAWVCTYGYGLSLKYSQHGEQLAAILESRIPPRTVVRKGSPPSWDTLLRHDWIRFWGDLDFEGLAIFERLRRYNPSIVLSGLYKPMVDCLREGEGHPYCKAVGKTGQAPNKYGNDIAPLLALCLEQAVDQEFVSKSQISQWWDTELEI